MRKEDALLAAMEARVAAGDRAQALAVTRELLAYHRVHVSRVREQGRHDVEVFRGFCQRFSNAWTTLVLDPSWDPQREQALSAFLFELTEFYAIVGSSRDGNLDQAMAIQVRRFKELRQPAEFLKMLLLWTPACEVWTTPFAHIESARAVVVAHALASVAALVSCSARSNEARNAAIALLASGRVVPADIAPFLYFPVFPSAWFRCSYATAPGKHHIKTVMNEAIVQVLASRCAAAPVPLPVDIRQPAGDQRPRLVVPMEWAFREGSAMHRCYAPIIRDLRRHFFTIGMIERIGSHPSAASLFDQYLCFEDVCPDGSFDVNTVAAAIRAMNPAMLLYPSVGMIRTVICLANLRLAPVQVMSVGHPATSMSQSMDYVITEEPFVGDRDAFHEQALLASAGSMAFDAPPLRGATAELKGPASDDVIEVAIPAVGHKIGWDFLVALREVERRATRPCIFHFFTGLAGTSFLEMQIQVTRVLPSARVHPFLEYDDYIEIVGTCHVHAASFPFGGTNSVIDSLRMGLPVVALEGREVHERVDAALLRRIDLADELVARSAEEYVAILAGLVSDPVQIRALRKRILADDCVGQSLMGQGRPEEFSDLLAALVR